MREKLIDLLMDTLPEHSPWEGNIKSLVDHLIANGVTIQKWIPVTERLPEKHGKFLVLVPSKIRGYGYFPLLLWYKPKRGFYDSATDWGDVEYDDVTHWMPLPDEPKEEI